MKCLRCGIETRDELCEVCNDKFSQTLGEAYLCHTGIQRVKEGANIILKGLADEFGLDLGDPNFKDTPARIARAYAEIFSGLKDTEKQIDDILATGFPCTYSQIVLATDVRAYSMCPHHFLPVEYDIDVAYIPKEGGNVLGISKLSRLVVILAKRPVLQEQLTDDITTYLMKIKGCEGAACIVRGRHFCMIMRGAKQPNSVTITSSMKGVFMKDSSAKAELMQLLKRV